VAEEVSVAEEDPAAEEVSVAEEDLAVRASSVVLLVIGHETVQERTETQKRVYFTKGVGVEGAFVPSTTTMGPTLSPNSLLYLLCVPSQKGNLADLQHRQYETFSWICNSVCL